MNKHSEVKDVLKYLIERELCLEWTNRLKSSVNKRDFVVAALSGAGLEYVATHAEVTSSWIVREFSSYLGKKQKMLDGRTGIIFAGVKGFRKLSGDIDVALVLDCVTAIKIPDGYIGEIVITKGSNVVLELGSDSIIYVTSYDSSKVSLVGTHKSRGNNIDILSYDSDVVNLINNENQIKIRNGSV